MFKNLKLPFFILCLIAFALTAIGCSFLLGNSEGNYVYIIKAEDYDEFKSSFFESKEKYKVPKVEELKEGEKYCVVVCSKAQTKDGSDLKYDDGELIISLENSDIPILQVLDITSDSDLRSPYSVSQNSVKFNFTPNGSGPRELVFRKLEFTAKGEGTLNAEYSLKWTATDGFYTKTNTPTASASLSFAKNIELKDLSVKYLNSENYVDGKFNPSHLRSEMQMTVGKEYYVVVTATAKAAFNEGDGEELLLMMEHLASDKIDVTLEMADSGKYESGNTENGKYASVSFKAPTKKSEEKDIVCIFKVTPKAAGNPELDFKFTSYDVGIVGKRQQTVRLSIGG